MEINRMINGVVYPISLTQVLNVVAFSLQSLFCWNTFCYDFIATNSTTEAYNVAILVLLEHLLLHRRERKFKEKNMDVAILVLLEHLLLPIRCMCSSC